MNKLILVWALTLAPCLVWAKPDFGIDVLRKENFKMLDGSHVALITNHTGVDKLDKSTVDLFFKAKNFKLVCLMTPEHGFRGSAPHGATVADSLDSQTKIPIYSLYGENSRPTDRMLKGVDTIVFDIQDVGVRFYTYVATMGMAMEEAAARGLKFVVLDRPNPIRGDIVEGDILDPLPHRMTGYYPLPVRHGLTTGEIARWWNSEKGLNAKLQVVPLDGWTRNQWYDQAGWDFIPPSPNIRTLTQALLYVGIGCFEATNISVGRGTESPFEVFGAPWLNAPALCAYLRSQNFSGVVFETAEFTPTDDLYKGDLCKGIRIRVTNRNEVRPYSIFIAAFLYLIENEKQFRPDWPEIQIVTGTSFLKNLSEEHGTVTDYLQRIKIKLDQFEEREKQFRLYP